MGQAADDVFAVRSAGNILTELGEASASMHYILSNYSVGASAGHKSVRAILVLGHTRCGAIAAAHAAFRPTGSGTVGLPPSLAALLYQIKPAVDFVLNDKNRCGLKGDETEDAISVINAYYSHLRIKRMARETRTAKGLSVYFGVYDVEDFYLLVTNIPGYPRRRCRDETKERVHAWADNAPVLERSESEAIVEDAVRFATRRR